MDVAPLLTAIRTDGDALVLAAGEAPSEPVPTCPGWDLLGLVRHVGGVHRWATEIVRSGVQVRRRDMARPDDAAGFAEVAGWYGEGLRVLCETLGEADPEATTWTFASSGDRRCGWWIRRMASETAVHRWDAEHARRATAANPVAVGVATAGVTEYLVDMLPAALQAAGVDLAGTFHLHATDGPGGGEWLVDFGTTPPAVTEGHAKADTAVRGPVSDLLLWLWNRLAVGGAQLEVFGSPEPVTAWPRLTL